MAKLTIRGAIAAGTLFAASMAMPGTASAATFGLTGLGTNGGAFATQLSGGINVRITAWSMSGTSGTSGTVEASTLGEYGAGLGATSSDDSGSDNTHTIDNQNRRDFLMFQFDKQVSLTDALFTAFSLPVNTTNYDTDFTVASGTTASAWTSTLAISGMTYAQLSTMMAGGISSYAGAASISSAAPSATQALNPLNKYGNVWIIGASFANPDSKFDGFKLSNLNAVAAVPEPATWGMMLAGFGIVGGAMRRRGAMTHSLV